MINPNLLSLLCCPETHRPLRYATAEELQRLNERIGAGSVSTRGGKPVLEKIEEGLLTEDGAFFYPIRNHLPILLIDESIELTSGV